MGPLRSITLKSTCARWAISRESSRRPLGIPIGGVKLNGARVNPYSLLDLPFKNGSTPAATVATPTPEATPNPQSVPVKE